MADIFSSRPANSPLDDLNLGAGSLRYEEIRSKTAAPLHFGPSTSLQFEYSSAGRYVMLSESYFEVHYTAFLKEAAAVIDNIASYKAYSDENTSSKTAAVSADGNKCIMALQKNWPDLAMNSIRHSIAGTQVASSNDVGLQRTVAESSQASGYASAGASAFASGTVRDRQLMLQHGTAGAIGWCPPLGLWKSNTLIPGSAVQRIDVDMKDISQYLMNVHEPSSVHATAGLVAANFKHASNGYQAYTTATKENQESYFCIDSIVLRVATVSPQDGRLPPASMLIETRDVEIQRIPVGTQQNCDRQLLIQGSTFKLAVFAQQDDDSSLASAKVAQPSLRKDTQITNLSLHVDGMQVPAPEYVLSGDSARDLQRVYLDFLAANGSLYSEAGESGCSITFNEYQARPLIMARLVSAPGLAKDLLVRARYNVANTTNKTIIVGAIHQRALALTFDGAGNCTSAQVTGL